MQHLKNQSTEKTKKNKKMFYEKVYEKYIDPFTDFGFKKLFGEENNRELLLDFLNELLHKDQGRIMKISYLNSERLGFSSNYRKAFFDIHCENDKGEKFIVELQKENQKFFKDRTVFYSTFPIVEQAPKIKKWNYKLKAVYVVAILDFVFDENENDPLKYRYDVMLSDIETHKIFYDKLKFIYLEMPKFTKEVDEIKTNFEKWMYVIKNLNCLEEIPEKLRGRIFKKLFAAAEVAKLTPEEYKEYLSAINAYRDWQNVVDTAEAKGITKGLAEGLEKGLAEGLEKGLAEGLEKGLAKGEQERLILQQKIEELKKLLKN